MRLLRDMVSVLFTFNQIFNFETSVQIYYELCKKLQ